MPDGNGRWAKQRGLTRLEGHRAGAENLRRVLEYLNECQIRYVTVYTFSTENWARPEEEVNGLFHLSEERINVDLPHFHQRDVRLRHLGRLQELPQSLQAAIEQATVMTAGNTGMTINLAFNYGGRAEIVDAARRITLAGVKAEEIDEALLGRYLYTAGLPDVDLLIRTGDELRLSNFLIWQTAYSEYYFTKILWPDFSNREIDEALLSFSQRKRRFGRL